MLTQPFFISSFLLFPASGFLELNFSDVSITFFVLLQQLLCGEVLSASVPVWFWETTRIPIWSMCQLLGSPMMVHQVTLGLCSVKGSHPCANVMLL